MSRISARAVLFDYGGTLDGEGSHWFDRTLQLYRRSGAEFSREDIRRAFYAAEEAIGDEALRRRYRLRPLLERHVELQIAVLGAKARRYAGAIVDGFCAMSEDGWRQARAALAHLHGQARLGVVSNYYGNLEVQLEEAGLSPLLDTVVESVHVGLAKPDPEIYRLAVRRLAVEPAQAVMVGDNFERDCHAAKLAGLRAVWLRPDGAMPPRPGVADHVIARLADIDLEPVA
jgi:putative hydrolase of the HAD superfamily